MAAVSSMLADFDCNNMGVDKLTYEIFSILENKFLFGCDHQNLLALPSKTKPHLLTSSPAGKTGKVRVLSIDAGGSTDGLLAAKSLAHLEATLGRKSGNPNARIAHFFDVVAGSGVGGVLAALLFTRGKDGGPIFSADEALNFIIQNGGKLSSKPAVPTGIFRRVFGPSKSKSRKMFKTVFGQDLTLKDTLKAVLIPCYDLTTGAPVLFSRADALEMDGCDFEMADVCGATVANKAVELRSADGRKKIAAIGGRIAMNNPTAAAITHVLNNKQEFPFCKGVEDLVVVSLGNGEMDCSAGNLHSSAAAYVRIAGDGAADMVDQAVAMAFDQARVPSNYVRIQGNGIFGKSNCGHNCDNYDERKNMMQGRAEAMLAQKNVESVLFQGKKLVESTNLEKLELFAGELIKEQERRKTSVLSPVILKQASAPSPRTSSATTLSTMSSSS